MNMGEIKLTEKNGFLLFAVGLLVITRTLFTLLYILFSLPHTYIFQHKQLIHSV